MKKVITLGAKRYSDWIFNEYELIPGDLERIKDADLIVFTGGSDVDPMMYGHKKHKKTYSDPIRDKNELNIFMEAVSHGIPMLGICRGSQFLTACQANGYVIQDVAEHAMSGFHKIKFNDDIVLPISSTHHQMMYPFDVENHEILAWAFPRRSYYYDIDEDEIMKLPDDKEPEVVFYPDTKCFCIQGHPEMMSTISPVSIKLKNLIFEKLFNEKNSSIRNT